VPELKIVRAIVLGVFKPEGSASSRAAIELNDFFRRHLEEWEPTHSAYLYERVARTRKREREKRVREGLPSGVEGYGSLVGAARHCFWKMGI